MNTKENTSNSNQILAKAIEEYTKALERISIRAFPEKEDKAIEDKQLAAYALNLCLVSISQIIDYNDLIVLEQEYNTILNNLNLEHMPKDEALLDILRQILDTVAFFRIQEGDKNFIELEYQQKMKNAIWSAVPNVAVIMGSGDPAAIAINLATQIGIGYMNYRRTKAENAFEKDKEMWKLQTSAMEQFHGLRRELFTTAWRLVDEYKIPDEYRLTEKQITEYNRALMEVNLYKRYEILKNMQEKYFQAYPQIYYYLAHTALEIAQEDVNASKDYNEKAKEYFEKYFKFFENGKNLLREDEIYAAAAFEFAQLLEGNEKKKYLDEALNKSNTNYDVIQMCVMSYIEDGKIDEACEWLNKLILSHYNIDINTQLLGMLYIRQGINAADDAKKDVYKKKFELLAKYTNIKNFVSFPVEMNQDTAEKIENDFLYHKQLFLVDLYSELILNFYTAKLNEYRSFEYNRGKATSKEVNFVSFLIKMQRELTEISEATGIYFNDLVATLKNRKQQLIRWAEGGKNLPKFDVVFKDLFVKACQNISTSAKTLDEIFKLETGIMNCLRKYLPEPEIVENDVELDIDEFFGKSQFVSEEFQNIKDKISERRKELNQKPEEYELVLHGTVKYKEYIKKHGLSSSEVVAVVDGKKGKDDLIFTTNGVFVTMSKMKKVGLYTAGGVGGLVTPLLAGAVAGTAVGVISSLSKKSIFYNNIVFKDGKMKLPRYHCNKEIESHLENLINDLKEITENDLSNEITDIFEAKKEGIKIIRDTSIEKQITEAIRNINSSPLLKNDDFEKRDKFILCSYEFLKNSNLKEYRSKLNEIKQDEQLDETIKSEVNSIIKCIEE